MSAFFLQVSQFSINSIISCTVSAFSQLPPKLKRLKRKTIFVVLCKLVPHLTFSIVLHQVPFHGFLRPATPPPGKLSCTPCTRWPEQSPSEIYISPMTPPRTKYRTKYHFRGVTFSKSTLCIYIRPCDWIQGLQADMQVIHDSTEATWAGRGPPTPLCLPLVRATFLTQPHRSHHSPHLPLRPGAWGGPAGCSGGEGTNTLPNGSPAGRAG